MSKTVDRGPGILSFKTGLIFLLIGAGAVALSILASGIHYRWEESKYGVGGSAPPWAVWLTNTSLALLVTGFAWFLVCAVRLFWISRFRKDRRQ